MPTLLMLLPLIENLQISDDITSKSVSYEKAKI